MPSRGEIKMKKVLKNLTDTILREGALLALIATFVCVPLQAIDKAENGGNGITKKLSSLSLQDNNDPLASKEVQDAFSWQNAKHYESVVKIFEDLADRELTSTIQSLIKVIRTQDDFFNYVYKNVIFLQRNRIFDWMNDRVLNRGNYIQECIQQQDNDSSESDDDEDSWRRSYINGYEGSGDDEDSEMTNSSSCDESENNSWDDRNDYASFEKENTEQEESTFENWQVAKLESILGITVDDIKEFTRKSIDINAIKRFLKEHCNGGGGMRYSWLLNEDIEGSLSASEDFASRIHGKMGVPEELIANILGGLWFDYDWEEFELDEPQFLQKTYIKTLKDLQEGKRATDVRENLLKRIRNLFTFNPHDFNSPLKEMHQKYLEFNKRKNWLGALIEWSLYSTYRKVFSTPSKRSKIKSYTTAVPALPVFQNFNREEYLLSRLNAAYIRAHAEYTKVYPHLDTKKIVFGPPCANRAELDIQKALGEIRGVGKFLEPSRKKGTENVFVPHLYFIVSSKPNQVSPSDGQQFFHVPLSFDGLPRQPLTRAPEDVVFEGVSDHSYFKRVKTDVVAGRVLQGKGKEEAEAEISELINGAKVCRDQKLVHSERGVAYALRQPTNVKKICKDFANLLKTSCGTGLYTVHGAAMLGYSTNTVCPCCTPTLIALQNSHEPGGFLNLLVQELNRLKGNVTFSTTGYNAKSGVTDWKQFRLNTFVTASIDFDKEGRDLAEEGQHSFGGNTKPSPKNHNPHAKLFFPNDEIDISEPVLLEDGAPDPCQRFFYEFVGKDVHALPTKDNLYIDKKKLKFPGVVFSSGSEPWGAGILG